MGEGATLPPFCLEIFMSYKVLRRKSDGVLFGYTDALAQNPGFEVVEETVEKKETLSLPTPKKTKKEAK